MPDQTHAQLAAEGVHVDTTAYTLSFEDTVAYLARRLPGYDLVVSCQNVADIYPALERLALRPPLIEHGGLVSEALAGPKHFTARYVGVCASIRDAAAARMPDRPHHAVEIPSMVDPGRVRPRGTRPDPRRPRHRPRRAARRLGRPPRPQEARRGLPPRRRPRPRRRARRPLPRHRRPRRLHARVRCRAPDARHRPRPRRAPSASSATAPDVPRLLAALDVFVWLSRGEGMPHVIAEAGLAGLATVATPDNGALQQIADGTSGLLTPHEDPTAAAAAILRLVREPVLRRRLGAGLRAHVLRSYTAATVVPQWQALFDAVLTEQPPAPPPTLFRSFLQGGWECSSHRLRSGRRLDLIAGTGHDANAAADYRQLASPRPPHHARRPALAPDRGPARHLRLLVAGRRCSPPPRRPARKSIWDLLHYGWPDDLDIWSPAFVTRFAAFARAAARHHREATDAVPFWCPVNEISFLAWAGGDAAYLNPFARGRGFELKVQLARAAIAAMHALRDVDPPRPLRPLRAAHRHPPRSRHRPPALGGRGLARRPAPGRRPDRRAPLAADRR